MKIKRYASLAVCALFLAVAILAGCGKSKTEKYQKNADAASEALGSHQYSQAIDLLKDGAEHGHSRSQGLLGVSYMMTDQESEGVKWIRKAAEGGDPLSYYNMAVCYEYGFGVEKNSSEAKFWVKKAENAGVSKPNALGWIQNTFKY